MSSAHEILIGPESQSHQIVIFLSPRARPAHQILRQASGYTASGLQITLFFKLLLFAVAGGVKQLFLHPKVQFELPNCLLKQLFSCCCFACPYPAEVSKAWFAPNRPPPNNYSVVVVSRASFSAAQQRFGSNLKSFQTKP